MEQLTLLENLKTPSSAPPFRYTGGKRVIGREVQMLMPSNTKEMISPFMGGGGLELQIAASGIHVHAYDTSKFISEFWKGFLLDPGQVCENAYRFYKCLNNCDNFEMVKRTVNELSRYRGVLKYYENQFEKSGVIWTLNCMVRDGRPGATFCNNRTEKGPNNGKYWGMQLPKFFIEQRYMDWWNPYIHIDNLDWRISMEKHSDIFLYADPPYVGKDNMYDSDNEKFQHEEFAKELKSRNSYWILSYGEHEMIRDLYSDYKILEPKWVKRALDPKNPRKDKVDGDELLILNI